MTNTARSLFALSLVAAAGLAVRATHVGAQDGDSDLEVPDSTAQRCIQINRIDHTEIVDEDTILFHMRGPDVYENNLPRRCPQLDSQERFMYHVTGSQLCSLDTITVLDDVGFGFMPGATCGLGEFLPISEEAAEDLARGADERGRRRE